jgi:hypothetical protein
LKCLVDKTESFLRRVRWKAYHYLKPSQSPVYETFGFRTTKSPPPIKELDEFEGKIFNLIQNVKFRKYHNEFQNNLERDLTNIRTDDKLMVAADKTTNFYRLDTPSYNKLLDTAITKAYKKSNIKHYNKNNIRREENCRKTRP